MKGVFLGLRMPLEHIEVRLILGAGDNKLENWESRQPPHKEFWQEELQESTRRV